VLVAARALQGAFGALLAPAALSLLATTFTDARERSTAFGIYGAIAGAGGAVGLLLGGILTQYLSWRWSLYVNLAFAVPAVLGAVALLHNQKHPDKPRIDVFGTLTGSGGLFALVYGFSNAQRHGWGATGTIASLAIAVVLLVGFVVIQRRAEHPLLPLRVVLDRNRGGSFLAMALASAGIFGVFLFLTYYLQQTLGFSPVKTGLAFLPMVGVLSASATISTAVLLPRTGPRPLLTLGMLLGAGGMVLMTQIGVDSSYAKDVLPGLLVLGTGVGLVMAPAINSATLGVQAGDAGVASALVNTMQQVGGSIGTALLSTLAASAASAFIGSHGLGGRVAAAAAVHGYSTAFWWAAGIFAIGALVCGSLLRSGAPQIDAQAEPAFAH
jgi:predicted MFS family arabinose efflux permease